MHVGGTIDEGYVISDASSDENKGVDADLTGNQFVWVPVEQNQKITAKVSSEEEIASIVITDPYGDDIVTKGESDNIGKNFNEQIEPTINGPYRIVVTTKSGESKKAFLNVHSLYAFDTFLDWQMNDEYAKAHRFNSIQELIEDRGFKTVEEAMFAEGSSFKEQHTETEDYKTKVNDNGGFYIGRYEAGDSLATSERTSSSEGTLVTKKNQFSYNYIRQTDALSKAKAYKTKLSSSLLTGAAWDRTIGWLYETRAKTSSELAIDSEAWGNYNNDKFSNTKNLIKTGQFSETKANNIYDIAGNLSEWTTEAHYATYRVDRGGNYLNDGSYTSASNRSSNGASLSANIFGFRVALYL